MSTPHQSFAALRNPGYRMHFATYALAMMADNIEHVISYWVLFEKFNSPALGGFAVVSHWVPFLLFSVLSGALADRYDPRRLIQIGMGMFIAASLGWGWFFVTDTLEIWHAMLLLTLHGFAGVLWQPASQLLLHDIVKPEQLPSAVRLSATARWVGLLIGPGMGGAIMLLLGPWKGIMLNTLFYLPLVIWLIRAPYGHAHHGRAPAMARAIRGFADVVSTMREVAGQRVIVGMMILAGGASFFVGGAYHAQMPGFAHDLGQQKADLSYSMLLAADAAGALAAGFALEGSGWLRPAPRTAMLLAMGWCVALAGFALNSWYPLALVLLFVAGFMELSFNAMAQTLVQINAPAHMRGRVIGLFNMSALGLRAFSGITVGVLGGWIGIHWSLAASALALLALIALLTGLTFGPRD